MTAPCRRSHRGLLWSLAIAGLLTVPATAQAAPQDFSAADQYVESVPTSRGPSPAITADDRAAQLPPAIAGRLHGEQGARLREAATSPRLGAPNSQLKSDGERSTPSLPSATVSAISDGGGGASVWLLLALLATTVAIAGTAVHSHFNRRDEAGRA